MPHEVGPRISPEMQAAQARLLQIRQALGIVPASPPELTGASVPAGPVEDPAPSSSVNWALRNATADLWRRRRELAGGPVGAVPVQGAEATPACISPSPKQSADAGTGPDKTAHETPIPRLVAAHPSLLMALLRQKREAAGRVWLLLRAIDSGGRGWLTTTTARDRLATGGSPLRVCGPRRLRQLLAEGDGLFWTRDDRDRIWLRGAARVAAALGVGRLQGYPVELPVAALTGGIQQTRAHFYAAFHSGRNAEPVSRATLRELSGVGARTQHTYDKVARVRRQTNLAVGERYSQEAHQQRAWQRGRSVFRLVDTRGVLGEPGAAYIAWQLPNSYEGPHTRRSPGGRKRLNRRLGDLVQKGIPGNDKQEAAERVFWPSGSKAARAFNRDPERDAFWRPSRGSGRSREQVWSVISGRRPDRFSTR